MDKQRQYKYKFQLSKVVFITILFLFIFVSEANLYNLDLIKTDDYKQLFSRIEILNEEIHTEITNLEHHIKRLKNAHENLLPKKPYLLINTTGNEIYLMSKNRLIHKGKCSTGSYILLKANKNRQWLFKTPRGIFRVKTKLRNPVWYKPDWAYLEQGLPIPARYTSDRYEKGVLGDRALALDDTHLIHGTLYKRMLGMPVTHGCIRLGDEELWIVYDNLKSGSKVIIY